MNDEQRDSLMPQALRAYETGRAIIDEIVSTSALPAEVVARLALHVGLTAGIIHTLEWRLGELGDDLERLRTAEDLRRAGGE